MTVDSDRHLVDGSVTIGRGQLFLRLVAVSLDFSPESVEAGEPSIPFVLRRTTSLRLALLDPVQNAVIVLGAFPGLSVEKSLFEGPKHCELLELRRIQIPIPAEHFSHGTVFVLLGAKERVLDEAWKDSVRAGDVDLPRHAACSSALYWGPGSSMKMSD